MSVGDYLRGQEAPGAPLPGTAEAVLALGRRLAAVARTREAWAVLELSPGTRGSLWLQGGCWLFAEACRRWLGEGACLELVASLWVDGRGVGLWRDEHALVRAGAWRFDARGLAGAGAVDTVLRVRELADPKVLRRHALEGPHGPERFAQHALRAFRDDVFRTQGGPVCPQSSVWVLQELLDRKLGRPLDHGVDPARMPAVPLASAAQTWVGLGRAMETERAPRLRAAWALGRVLVEALELLQARGEEVSDVPRSVLEAALRALEAGEFQGMVRYERLFEQELSRFRPLGLLLSGGETPLVPAEPSSRAWQALLVAIETLLAWVRGMLVFVRTDRPLGVRGGRSLRMVLEPLERALAPAGEPEAAIEARAVRRYLKAYDAPGAPGGEADDGWP